jgi:hypothetical protein
MADCASANWTSDEEHYKGLLEFINSFHHPLKNRTAPCSCVNVLSSLEIHWAFADDINIFSFDR